MVKVAAAYNNFSRGRMDHDLMGRFDLPIYTNGADVMTNWLTNFKGGAKYRAGFEMMVPFQDCVLVEFKFSANQNYLLCFYAGKIRFLSYDASGNFGWVLDSSAAILEVTTPYTMAEARQVQYTQNDDIMLLTVQGHAPKELKRTAANAFTLSDYAFTGTNPFGASGPYPACCLFYDGRLYFANTSAKPTTIWGSESANYKNFVVPTTVTDASPLQFTLSGIAQPIEWLFAGDNSMIVGAEDGVVPVNGGGVGVAITASTIDGRVSTADPASGVYPLRKDGFAFYVDRTGRRLQYFSYDILSETFGAQDANLIAYQLTDGGVLKIRHKKDADDIIYVLRSNRCLSALNFNKDEENIIGWTEFTTDGSCLDIAVITDNAGDPQLFLLVERPDGVVYIERMAAFVDFAQRDDFYTGDEEADEEACRRYLAEQLRGCVYLDNAMTLSGLISGNALSYNPDTGALVAASAVFSSADVGRHVVFKTSTGYERGRLLIESHVSATEVTATVLQELSSLSWDGDWYLSFTTISGLEQYNGRTIGVVTDGGYLDDFTVEDGVITLNSPTCSAVVGYRYAGVIKSFPIGFIAGVNNFQAAPKSISHIGLRCVASMGGKFGTSRYRLEDVQELAQGDINYLPPLPIDGTKFLTLADDHVRDKCYYVVQDLPLPFALTCVMLETSYGGAS